MDYFEIIDRGLAKQSIDWAFTKPASTKLVALSNMVFKKPAWHFSLFDSKSLCNWESFLSENFSVLVFKFCRMIFLPLKT